MLGSEQVGTLITALGCGIGGNEFDIAKLRYHKIVIMTDADVDGSHIRTLLLTFFYRHMREIIEKGYLYIAQPPLYKVKRGSSETYLKNEAALQEYLLKGILSECRLSSTDNYDNSVNAEGDELDDLVHQIIRFVEFLDMLAKKFNRDIAESLAINNLLNEDSFSPHKKEEILTSLAPLNPGASEPDKTDWEVEVGSESIEFFRLIRGVKHSKVLMKEHVLSKEFVNTAKLGQLLSSNFAGNVKLHVKGEDHSVLLPSRLLEILTNLGKKGLSVQRFKGLGEMNSEQLWETTLDASKRTLLQVQVNDVDEIEEVVSTLMGGVVEPRRDFIKSNALSVVNLDV